MKMRDPSPESGSDEICALEDGKPTPNRARKRNLVTRQDAIDAKCRDCIYDPYSKGNWKQQVHGCQIVTCALWPYRPRSRAPLSDAELQEDRSRSGT